MRLYEFVPIADPVIRDESVIDSVFGPEFYVVDEAGQLLTSAHNRNLLRRACQLLQHLHLDRKMIEDGLDTLSGKAETLRQSDYEQAVRRESQACPVFDDESHPLGDLDGIHPSAQ